MHTASISATPAAINTVCNPERNVPVDAASGSLLDSSVRMCRQLVSTIPILIVTLGPEGVLICRSLKHRNSQHLRDLKLGKIIEVRTRIQMLFTACSCFTHSGYRAAAAAPRASQ